MADLPTRQELFRRWRAGALAVPGTQLSALKIDEDGSDANLLAASDTAVGEELVNRMARALAGCFEDTSTNEQLDRVIFDRKGLPRKPAAPAVGKVQLTRATAAAGGGVIVGGLPGSGPPDPTRIRTNQGIIYLITQNAVFGALDLGPIEVDIQAEQAGLAFEVGDTQSWNFVDVPFDPTIQIANAAETAGAANEETDDEFKARAKDFFRTVRRGTQGAIEFGLLSTPGIASVSVIETINPENGYPVCINQAFILDALGQANETLAARGLLSLLEFRAMGIPVVIIPGTPNFINIRFSGTEFDTAVVTDTAQAADDVRTQIIAALNNNRPGARQFRSAIIAAGRQVPGFVFEPENLIEPAATLIPATPDITFRTRRELIEIG